MIKIFKKTYSLFRVLFALFLLLLLFAVVSAKRILSEDGTPDRVKSHLLEYFKTKGVYCEADKIYLSLSQGVTVSNPILYSDENHTKVLVKAAQLKIRTDALQLLYSSREIKAIELTDATIKVPFKSPKYPRLSQQELSPLNIKLDFNRHQASVEKLSLETGSIRANIRGDIENLPTFSHLLDEMKKPSDSQFTLESLQKRLDDAAPTLKPLLDSWFDELHFKEKISLDLNFSVPYDHPENSAVSLRFKLPSTLYRGLAIRRIDGEIEFKENNCNLTHFVASFDKDEFIKGNLHYNLAEQVVSGKIQSVVFPTRLLKLSKIDDPSLKKVIARFRPTDTPPALDLTLKPTHIGKNFEIEAAVDLKNTWYKHIFFNKVKGQLSVNSKRLKFSNVKAVINHTIPADLQGQYFFPRDELFMNIAITGDPSFISDFLGPRSAAVYTRIWRRFKWKKDSPPTLRCSFKNIGAGESFMLTGAVSFQDFKLHDQPISNLTSELVVHLTDDEQYVLFHHLDMRIDKAHLAGKFAYSIPFGKRGVVDFQSKGNIDIKKIFKIVDAAEVNDTIKFLSFSDNSKIECQGQVDLDDSSKSWMLANLDADYIKLRKYTFNHITAHVKRNGGFLQVSNLKAKLYKGDVNGIFTYNYHTDKANLDFNIDKLDLAYIPHDNKNDLVGRAHINLSTALDFSTGDKDPLLNGQGDITITDADFWQVPLFTKLTKFVSSGTGKITKAEAKLSLSDHLIKVTDFETDGSVISLKGEGTVNYSTEKIDFLLKTVPLKDVLWKIPGTILSLFVNKIIVFELKGDFDNQEWTPAPGLLK